MTIRTKLPQRRRHDVNVFEFHGNEYTLGLGYHDDNVKEVFIDCRKVTSEAAYIARDMAIMLSIALQYGVPVEVLLNAITREEDGAPSSVAGAVLDIIRG